jgi:hypothetical protein
MPARTTAVPRESGIVLIAVVIFVLALTILVLSLYGLSSYEAQFFQRSVDGEQAFQSAMGGLERAKFLLCSVWPYQLGRVKLPWPAGTHVVAAVAMQTVAGVTDSLGPVHWDPDSIITIRVTADVNGEQRTVEGRFAPHEAASYYKQLISTSGGVFVEDSAGTRLQTVSLVGPVWQGSPAAGLTWPNLLAPPPVEPTSGFVEDPAVAPYFAAHPPDEFLPGGTGSPYHLQHDVPGLPVFYSSPAIPDSFFHPTNAAATVVVRGLAVWLFPGGVRFDSPVTINAQGHANDACLVIVAGPAGPYDEPTDPTVGIRFGSGLNAYIPVILVTSGTVAIEQIADNMTATSAADLAVYAHDVRLTGPRNVAGTTLNLMHPPTSLLDSRHVDQLAGQNALPNATAGHSLALVPGSWHASHP